MKIKFEPERYSQKAHSLSDTVDEMCDAATHTKKQLTALKNKYIEYFSQRYPFPQVSLLSLLFPLPVSYSGSQIPLEPKVATHPTGLRSHPFPQPRNES